MEQLKGALKKTFFAGLVVVVPIVITALALIWLFNFLDGFFSPFLRHTLGIEFAGLGILAEIILILLVGMVATNVLGSRLLKFLQDFLIRIPIVKSIYPTVRQLVEAFSSAKDSSFKKVVLVEYPQKGNYSLGFLTRELSLDPASQNFPFYSVYVPTNNLYLGHVVLFKAEEVIITDFTIEEGFKIILSGGTTFPPAIRTQNRKFIS